MIYKAFCKTSTQASAQATIGSTTGQANAQQTGGTPAAGASAMD